MTESFDMEEKKALAAIVKFIVGENGGITDYELDKIERVAAEKGFGDFRQVFAEIGPNDMAGLDLENMLGFTVHQGRKAELFRIAFEIVESRMQPDPEEALFLKTVGLVMEN